MTFNINHHIYAATQRCGGFGVFYQSRDLAELTGKMMDTINKNANYNVSDVLRNNPPINFAFYSIDDQGTKTAALLRSKYTGAANHTPERAGNFLTHTVVFDNTLENYRLPSLFRAIPFLDSLTIEEEQTFTPPLETLDYVQHRGNQALADALQFICQDMRRLSVLLQIIDDIMKGWLETRGHSIVICTPTNDECCRLIFALYTILPPPVINQYSFATYIYNPANVPFQLCGVVPGCIFTGLDPEYFKVYDVNDQFVNYAPRHKFTSILKKLIINQDIEWLAGLDKVFSDYNVKSLGKQAEIPFEIEEFKDNVFSKDISEMYRILGFFSPSQAQIKDDLIRVVRDNNPNLYLEYLTNEMRGHVRPGNMLFETIEYYLKKVSEVANDRKVLSFYQEMEKNIPQIYDKATISANLLQSDTEYIKRLVQTNFELRNHLFRRVESEWGKMSSSLQNEFASHFWEEIRNGNYPNIQLWLQKKQVYDDIRQGRFLDNFESYQQLWATLQESDKMMFIRGAIDNKNFSGRMSESLLLDITHLVARCFNNPAIFWNDYFSLDNEGGEEFKDPKYSDNWPLSLIKRHVLYYETVAGRISLYQDLIANLSEYEIHWLSDELIAHHQKKDHKLFIDMLPPKEKKHLLRIFCKR